MMRVTPSTLQMADWSPLRPYQQQGVHFLNESRSAVLADEMGLGKTVQAAVAIQLLVLSADAKKILLVSPASLCLQWERELVKWAPSISCRRVFGTARDRRAHLRLPVKVWIVSYEQVRLDLEVLREEGPYDLVVLDEAQRIKNRASTIALSCRQIPRKRAWALSGTPIENSEEDLISIYAFAAPGLLQAGLSSAEIKRRIRPHFLRRRKRDVAKDLPPIIVSDWHLELVPSQRIAYVSEWTSNRDQIKNGEAAYMLALITRLKQICNFEPESRDSIKFQALSEIIDITVANQEKLIVVSQFTRTLGELRERISGLPTMLLTGDLSLPERDNVVAAFETATGPLVLLLSLKAGGVGLNLNSASSVVLFDRWWNPSVEDQAIQRAHRFGRTSPLHVIQFVTVDTVEERISEILEKKKQLFSDMVDELATHGVERFTKDELIHILS